MLLTQNAHSQMATKKSTWTSVKTWNSCGKMGIGCTVVGMPTYLREILGSRQDGSKEVWWRHLLWETGIGRRSKSHLQDTKQHSPWLTTTRSNELRLLPCGVSASCRPLGRRFNESPAFPDGPVTGGRSWGERRGCHCFSLQDLRSPDNPELHIHLTDRQEVPPLHLFLHLVKRKTRSMLASGALWGLEALLKLWFGIWIE